MTSRLAQSYRLTLENLTPLHVGGGRGRLVHDVDFAIVGGTVYLIDLEKVWALVGDERLAHWNELDFRLSGLITAVDYPRCAASAVPVTGHLETAGGLLDQIRDAYGRPYLPGSSVKGAIRSALFRSVASQVDFASLGRSRSWAGQPWERATFGRSPNFDLLRTLRIADSVPLNPDELRAVVVAIYSLRSGRLAPKGPSYRLNVIAFPAGTRLECAVSVDRWTLQQRSQRLDFGDAARWIETLAEQCRQAADVLIRSERGFYAEVGQPAPERFYRRLADASASLGPGEFLLPIGWGTGWLAKAGGPALRDQEGFDEVRQRYHLGYSNMPFMPFPKSRRLVETAPDRPEIPVGWVKARLEEVG
jgi:CRISPR-associated protein Csm5